MVVRLLDAGDLISHTCVSIWAGPLNLFLTDQADNPLRASVCPPLVRSAYVHSGAPPVGSLRNDHMVGVVENEQPRAWMVVRMEAVSAGVGGA